MTERSHPSCSESVCLSHTTCAAQRSAKLRADWEQRVAKAGKIRDGGEVEVEDVRGSRRSQAYEEDRGRGQRTAAGVRDREAEMERHRSRRAEDVPDRYEGGGEDEEGKWEEGEGAGREGGSIRGRRDVSGGQRRISSVREHGTSGRLAGRLEVPQGVYMRDEDAPDRCADRFLLGSVLVCCMCACLV